MVGRPRGRENVQYKAKEREEFFRRLDRGGTIRAVAAELGLSVDACYRWRQEANVSTTRAKSRMYTAEEKAEFFRRLKLTANVSKVAKELGFVRITCYKWAHQAGIFTGKDTRAQRAQFQRLRADGVSRAEAAKRVGIDKRSAQDWDKGIKQVTGGRAYPGGRVVRYRQAAILANVKNPRDAYTRGVPVDLARLETLVDARFLSLIEREQIHDLRSRGESMRAIARALGRSPSTISRELGRNTATTVGYLPYAAHRIAASRRPRQRTRKLECHRGLRSYVEGKLRKRWSPEQISNRLVKDFPDDQRMRVSTETIYQAIYIQSRGALKREIAAAMRRGRTTRKPRRNPAHRTSRFVDPMISITERPAEADDRAIPGHWEGDLIIGTMSRSAIGTLVERSSRFVTLVHLQHDHTAETVRDGLVKTVAQLPATLRRSLTWDQGAEMSGHVAFRVATAMDVYFCDPASPWQRGSNENTNGLLRQYFPKGTDLSRHTPDELQQVAAELNARPRKSLGWDTPAERLRALLEPS
jgi:IS30 family transposase